MHEIQETGKGSPALQWKNPVYQKRLEADNHKKKKNNKKVL